MDRYEIEYVKNLEKQNNAYIASKKEEQRLRESEAEKNRIPTYDEFYNASKPPIYNKLVASAKSNKDPNQKLAQEALDKFETKTKAAYFEKYPQSIAVGDRAKLTALNWVTALTPTIFAAGVYCISKLSGVFETDIQSIQAAAYSFAAIGGTSALINLATRDKLIEDIQNKTIEKQRKEKADKQAANLKTIKQHTPTPGFEDPTMY